MEMREGIVYLDLVCGARAGPPVDGTWECGAEGVRESGAWTSVDEAIRWGRQRAPRVILRRQEWIHATRYHNTGDLVVRLHSPVQGRIRFFSVGEQAATGDPDVERWPDASNERDSDALAGYDGTVMLIEGQEIWDGADSPGWIARWEARRDDSMRLLEQVGPAWNHKLDQAVEWARQRARIVLICTGPPSYNYYSAGQADIPGVSIPRWSPPHRRDELPAGTSVQSGGFWTAFVPERTFPIDEPIQDNEPGG